MLNVIATLVKQTDDGNRIGNVEQDDAGGDHAVECGRGAKVEQP